MSSRDNAEALTGYGMHPAAGVRNRAWAAILFFIGTGGFIWLNGFLLPSYFGQKRAGQNIRRAVLAPEKTPKSKPAPVPAGRSVKAQESPETAEAPQQASVKAPKGPETAEPPQQAAVIKPTMDELTASPVFFKSGSTKLMDEDLPRIDAVAGHMLENPGTRIVITGFGYKGKKLRRNKYIARQRAREIRSRLAGHDIDRKRIIVRDMLVTWSKSHNDVSIHRAEMKLLEPDSDGR